MNGSCDRTGDGNKLRGGRPFRINIDNFCISQNLYSLFLHPRDFSESIFFVAVFQIHYCLFLCVSKFIFIVSVHARVMWTVADRCGWFQRAAGARERMDDGSKSSGVCLFRIKY